MIVFWVVIDVEVNLLVSFILLWGEIVEVGNLVDCVIEKWFMILSKKIFKIVNCVILLNFFWLFRVNCCMIWML